MLLGSHAIWLLSMYLSKSVIHEFLCCIIVLDKMYSEIEASSLCSPVYAPTLGNLCLHKTSAARHHTSDVHAGGLCGV